MNITKIENNMNQNFCGFKVNKYAISQLREDSLNELFRMKKVFASSKYIDVDITQRASWKSPDPVPTFKIKKLPKNVECDGRLDYDISEISVSRDSVALNRKSHLLGLEVELPDKCGEYKLTPGFWFWETLDRIEALEQAFQKKEASNKVLNKFSNTQSKKGSDVPVYINPSLTKIKKIIGREILDSRGNPAVEAEVFLESGISARGVAPSGASTGIFEALELRDGDKLRYNGKGVLNAVNNINSQISKFLLGQNVTDIYTVDNKMITWDGTQNKTNLGANAMLAVSIACARAASNFLEIPLYKFIGGSDVKTLPVPMMNILNGGAHVANSLDNQDFMIVPVGAKTFKEGLRWCSEVYYSLKNLLKKEGYATSVGDVGGFAPNLKNEEEALEHLVKAIKNAGYKPYDDFVLAIDAASSQWKHPTKGIGHYLQPKSGKEYTSDELIAHYEDLANKFPLASIEDGLDEEDWVGWQKMTERLGKKVQLVGDDLFVTNTKRLKKGIENNCANSILIKPNQIGTISETLEATEMAQKSSYSTIISNRSGETADTTIADLAVATNSGQIKTGAPSRSERVEKYNQLLRIEEQLGDKAQYLGKDVFNISR